MFRAFQCDSLGQPDHAIQLPLYLLRIAEAVHRGLGTGRRHLFKDSKTDTTCGAGDAIRPASGRLLSSWRSVTAVVGSLPSMPP